MAKEIYKKLMEVQRSVAGLMKDRKATSYDYVSGDKILSVIRPKMDQLGLLLLPEVDEASFTPVEYQVKTGPKKEMFCQLTINFTWVDTESGETLEQRWVSTGQNGFDKSLGSALTYGERYYLLKTFHVATDKDDVDAPKTAEQELAVEQAIAYINGLQSAEAMQQAWQYYSQWFGKDKDFIKAFNTKMKALNGTGKK